MRNCSMKFSALEKGLSHVKARQLQKIHGKNSSNTTVKNNTLLHLIQIGSDPLFLLLILCGALYFVLGDFQAGAIFLGWTILVGLSTLYQQFRTQHALAALQKLAPAKSAVVRGGKLQQIYSIDLVPGDIVLLTEGNRIAADGELLSDKILIVDESILSGESQAIQKSLLDKNLYSGTLIAKGSGLMKVTAIGSNSTIGKINALLKTEVPEISSPIKIQIKKLVRYLLLIAIGVCIIITVTYTFLRSDFITAFLNGLAAAMAILPEEFPLVFGLFISLGAWRMTKQKVLTRNPGVIEWLGSTTVLCTDKTGTLTENNMSIHTLCALNSQVRYNVSTQEKAAELIALEQSAILATPKRSHDAIEKAIRTQLHPIPTNSRATLVKEYELSSACLAMTLCYSNPTSSYDAYSKGAPETILELCQLTKEEQQQFMAQAEQMASDGLRVLGFASAHWTSTELPAQQAAFEFNFLGFIGFEDPLRKGVVHSIHRCRDAGIRVMMVTGDFPNTAKSIANQAGFNVDDLVINGSSENFEQNLKKAVHDFRYSILARINPKQKLQLVEALQVNREIVAMTGDGVNDAPALKAAKIGISMGMRGCDVAREASSLILLDDNFSHIVGAIQLGRNILDKLQKALLYILAIHVPIIGISILPAFIPAIPVLLMPMHIVLLELIIDPVSTLAFESAIAEKDLMKRPPRDPQVPFFGQETLLQSLLYGTIIFSCVCATLLTSILLNETPEVIRALCYGTLMIANLLLVLQVLSRTQNTWQTLLKSKAIVWIIFTVAIIALCLIWLVPTFQVLFSFKLPSILSISYALGYGILSSFLMRFVKKRNQQKKPQRIEALKRTKAS